MSTTNLNIRTNKEIKLQADLVCSELGMNLSTAVNMFLRALVREQGLPFNLKLKEFNEETILAIEEGRKIARDKSVKGYKTMAELKEALEV